LAALAAAGAWAVGPASAQAAAAQDETGQPRWEAGVATGGGRVSDYPGADQTHARGIVLPVFIYRGPVLRVDDGGIRGRFVDTPDWTFDLSATAAFNARNNDARQGMAGLDYLFGVGPQWIYKGLQRRHGGPTLHLKVRALMSTNLKRIDPRGVTFDPELRWRLQPVEGSRTALTLSLQPTWASGALQRYFYQVAPGEATSTRPAFAARAGYLGTQAGATVSGRPAKGISWFVSAQFMSLRGAANVASPLLRDRSNASIGAGVVWTPWRSADLVGD